MGEKKRLESYEWLGWVLFALWLLGTYLGIEVDTLLERGGDEDSTIGGFFSLILGLGLMLAWVGGSAAPEGKWSKACQQVRDLQSKVERLEKELGDAKK